MAVSTTFTMSSEPRLRSSLYSASTVRAVHRQTCSTTQMQYHLRSSNQNYTNITSRFNLYASLQNVKRRRGRPYLVDPFLLDNFNPESGFVQVNIMSLAPHILLGVPVWRHGTGSVSLALWSHTARANGL